ncbi:MAG: ABC transporter permease [Saprospiraceae bacterium]
MIQNNLKLALRNLQKRPGYATLHLLGLATGMACCLLILQYVLHERSYDQFHPAAERIVRLELDNYQKGKLSWKSATSYPAFGPTMKRDFSEIEDFCRLHDAEYVLSNPATELKFAEKKGYYADPGVLRMFHIPLLSGNPATALEGPDKIILSEKTARKYFGSTDVLGKTLSSNDNGRLINFEVTGVFENYPNNSHLTLDYLISYRTLGKIMTAEGDTTNSTETAWGWYDFYTYFKLQPDVDPQKLAEKLPAFNDKYINSNPIYQKAELYNSTSLQALTDIHLYSNLNQEAEVNGNGKAVGLLFLIAFFILAIAWINYINLATARAMERAKEVGVRKVSGAGRWQLISQFLTESFLLNTAALVVAVLGVWIAMPAFGNFLGKTLPFLIFTGTQPLWIALVFAGGTLFSGLYPAFVLSGFKPVSILKGLYKNTSSGQMLRRGLIVGQFTASIALIVGAIVVSKQVQFMRNQNPGFERAQTLVLQGPNTVADSVYQGILTGFKNEVLQIPGVSSLSGSSSVPGDEIYWTSSFRRLRSVDETRQTLYILGADLDFTKSYDLKMVAGRNFEPTDKNTCMLNESAARMLGFENPEKAIGDFVQRGRRDTFLVCGVMRDFHHLGLQKPIEPMIVRFQPDSRSYFSLKMEGEDYSKMLSSVEAVWQKHFYADPFDYFFLDEFFDRQYKADVQFGKVFSMFTVLAMLIACLGLLGLTSYNILQRTKEIGIRKVLGASVTSITGLLAKDFLKLVLVAILIASPLAYYFMQRWLGDFAYHIDLQWWMFVVAALVAVGIAFLTVSFQSVRAALTNPVESLRSE